MSPRVFFFLLLCYLAPLCCHANQPTSRNASVCQQLDPSPLLRQFVDELSLPPLIHAASGTNLTIGAYKIKQKLHRDLPPTWLYAYGTSSDEAHYPGPTLLAKQNVPTTVRWENHIEDTQHMLTVDESIHWAAPTEGGVPTVSHLHGAEVISYYDGHPEAWFTPKQETGPTFYTQTYTYPNEQSPTALWYHDHTLGITRLNVACGLLGMYIITSTQEESLNLTMGIPLIVQDKQFYGDGSMNFPDVGIIPELHAHWCPEYYGDTILVNGQVWPYVKVLPKAYRFRILNGCSARFLILTLSMSGVTFYQIGTDGGFLRDGPWNLSTITMAPAERVDVIIDFSNLTNGTYIVLNNTGPTPFPSGDISLQPPGTMAILQFIVVDEGGLQEGVVEIPADFAPLLDADEKPLDLDDVVVKRTLWVVEYDDSDYLPIQFTLENKTWEDPVALIAAEGDTEMWELINLRINAHPLHIHLTNFQVINQQTFANRDYEAGTCSLDIAYPEDGTCFAEYPHEPYDYQKGWKDTVILWPSVVTRVVIRFTTRQGRAFGFDPSQGPGYLWHCHIVDHEDNVMMRPFMVTRNSTRFNTTTLLAAISSDSDRMA